MRFFSDNAAAACPQVLEALVQANQLDTAYDGDVWSQKLDGVISDLFGKQERAIWVTTGTAANCLGLAALCPAPRRRCRFQTEDSRGADSGGGNRSCH